MIALFFGLIFTIGLVENTSFYQVCKSQEFKGTIGSSKVQCSDYKGLSEFDK